jgi:hypothetical protein
MSDCSHSLGVGEVRAEIFESRSAARLCRLPESRSSPCFCRFASDAGLGAWSRAKESVIKFDRTRLNLNRRRASRMPAHPVEHEYDRTTTEWTDRRNATRTRTEPEHENENGAQTRNTGREHGTRKREHNTKAETRHHTAQNRTRHPHVTCWFRLR